MISIIIPTYHRTSLLIEHLTFMRAQLTGFEYEVIIVNDAKDEDVILPPELFGYKVINNEKSGVASARNFGAGMAKYDWFLFLDDDMLMNGINFSAYVGHCDAKIRKTVNLDWEYTPETIKTLNQKAFGRFLINYGFTSLKGWCNLKNWESKVQILEGLTSQNLLIHKTVFSELNGYNETFPFAGAEDFEFAQRAKKAGIISYVDTTSVMFHNELDRLEKKEWFRRKHRAGITNRIAYEKGYQQVFIPNNWKFKSVTLTNGTCKFILFFSERFKALDTISFMCYRLLLGQALNAGFYEKKYSI